MDRKVADLTRRRVQEGALIGRPAADPDIVRALDFSRYFSKNCQMEDCHTFVEAEEPPRVCHRHFDELMARDPSFMTQVRLAQKVWVLAGRPSFIELDEEEFDEGLHKLGVLGWVAR